MLRFAPLGLALLVLFFLRRWAMRGWRDALPSRN